MKCRHTLLLCALPLGLILLTAAAPPADAPPGPIRWEYGRLTADGETYVLVTTHAVYRAELPGVEPANDGTIYRGPMKLTEKRFDRRLYALNVFAGEGWEIEPGADLKQGEWYLVRRKR